MIFLVASLRPERNSSIFLDFKISLKASSEKIEPLRRIDEDERRKIANEIDDRPRAVSVGQSLEWGLHILRTAVSLLRTVQRLLALCGTPVTRPLVA